MGQENSHGPVDDSVKPDTLDSRTVEGVAKLIKSGKATRIVVLTGAGISTSAGIPDFRSPDTGLYANLARLNLPYAEAVFDISYFRQNPNPFYMLAKELYPGKYKPTITHAFIALLAKKDLLHMHFTQNIDCLDRAAGVPSEKIVEAHGSFATQRCIECKTEFPEDLMLEAVESGDVPHCLVPQCNGLVKPDIVFFGEQLPARFHQNQHVPAQAQLMLVMGTSLTVQPFASLPAFARDGVPRVLFNLERVGGLGTRPDDVLILEPCDGGVRKLADALGWREELEILWGEVSPGAQASEIKKERKTGHEALEEEIEELTKEVDETLKLSNGHKEYLEKSLEDEMAKRVLPDIGHDPASDPKTGVGESTGKKTDLNASDETDTLATEDLEIQKEESSSTQNATLSTSETGIKTNPAQEQTELLPSMDESNNKVEQVEGLKERS